MSIIVETFRETSLIVQLIIVYIETFQETSLQRANFSRFSLSF